VSPTPKDRVLYSNHIIIIIIIIIIAVVVVIIIIIIIIIPNSENMLQSYSWAQSTNRPLTLESSSLNSELNEGIISASRSGHFTHTERASDTHWKFLRELKTFIRDLCKVKPAVLVHNRASQPGYS